MLSKFLANQSLFLCHPCVLTLKGIVGEKTEDDVLYMWTHKKFEIGYNGDQVRNTLNFPRNLFLFIGNQ